MNTSVADDREWFLLWFRLDQSDGYALWYSSERDGLESVRGKIPFWKTSVGAQEYAERRGYTLSSEPPKLHDLDYAMQLTNGGELADFSSLLSAWNLFSDVAATLQRADYLQVDQSFLDTYNHLFFLSGIGPFKDVAPPSFSEQEADQLRQLLAAGLRIFRESLKDMAESQDVDKPNPR